MNNKKAILLTWNPKKFNDGGDGTGDYKLALQQGDTTRWNCNTNKVSVGDEVYLIRVGVEPRGIVAKGTVTREIYKDEDWADASKERTYIDFKVDDLRLDCSKGLLPMILLNMALPDQQWSPFSSGIAIRTELLPTLHQLWQTGQGKHSLQQYIDWSRNDPTESRQKWLKTYRDITALANAIRQKQQVIDDQTLQAIWRDKDNGVSGIGPGILPQQAFERNQALLRQMTEQICTKPDEQTFLAIDSQWREAVDRKDFDKMYRAVYRRVFAAAAPDLYTTLMRVGHCRQLLAVLKSQFQLNAPIEKDNWVQLNQSIKLCLRNAGVTGNDLETNIALWGLYEASGNAQQADNNIEDEDLDMANAPVKAASTPVPVNQILYGPPGTGKTHSTIDEALRILEPTLLSQPGSTREHLLAAFNRYKDAGQIVFCTFHQSFSYEDFVEGLRASSDNGQIRYSVEPGIFKRICEEASKSTGIRSTDDILNAFIEQVAETPVTLETMRGKRFSVSYKYGNTTLTCMPEASEGGRELPANISHVRQYLQGIRPSNIYCESYVKGIADYLANQSPDRLDKQPGNSIKPFVLIIDEINRGNISRIFGELITLIEPSKRAGQPESLSVQLPYSKDPFSVPSNVYLIGTMNTADRSLAGLDIALRRRFTFKEMSPQPGLLDEIAVEGLNIGSLLRTMNERIEVLLDRDHCLGHAYFLSLKEDNSLERLAFIFRQQILPLLQEYFFEDWERIAWVLNDHRKTNTEHQFIQRVSTSLSSLFGSDTAGRLQDRRWQINEAAFNNMDSYRGILGAGA